MATYLKKVKDALGKFTNYNIQQVPRVKNSNVDALARLVISKDVELLKLVPEEVLKVPAIEGKPEVMPVDSRPSWKDPIIKYLVDGELPKDKQQAKRLKISSVEVYLPRQHFVLARVFTPTQMHRRGRTQKGALRDLRRALW